jgi:hypothetical protein
MLPIGRSPESGAPNGYFDDYWRECGRCRGEFLDSELWRNLLGYDRLCDECKDEEEANEGGEQ